MHYCVGANYYWLLVEGLYLHNLLALMAFSENRFFGGYLLIGWGKQRTPDKSSHIQHKGNEVVKGLAHIMPKLVRSISQS